MQLMSREQLVTNISLDRLKQEDTADLVKGIFAHSFNPDFTKRLYQETEGNPFFIEELLRAMVLDGVIYRHNAVWEAKDISKVVIPSSVKDTVLRGISALDPECQEVLKYAAVIGQIFPFQTLARTTGKPEETLADLLESIEKQGIIYMISEETVLGFNHAKLQEVIYAEIPKYKKNIMHKKTAQALEELNQENLAGVAIELTYHYQQAGIPEKTVEYALLAGEVAEKKYTPTEAVQHYTTALTTLEKMKTTPENKQKQLKTADRIAYMYYITGEWNMSMNHIILVGKLAKETKNQLMLAESYRNIGMICVIRGERDKAMENLHNALRISKEINDERGIAETQYCIGTEYWQSGEINEAMNVLNKSLAQALKIDDKGLISKMTMEFGYIHFLRGQYEDSSELMKRGLNIAESIGDKYEMARAYHHIGDIYGYGLGDLDTAIDWYDRCIEISEKIGFFRNLGRALCDIALCYAKKGAYPKAEKYIHEVSIIFEKIGEKRMIGWYQCVYGVLYKGKKEWEKSQENFEKGIDILKKNRIACCSCICTF